MNRHASSAYRMTNVQCKSRKKEMSVYECIDSYVEANAFANRRSACFRCLHGQKTRAEFASS